MQVTYLMPLEAGGSNAVGCFRYASQPREVVLDCGPYTDKSGLSSCLQAELDDALYFLSDCNFCVGREDRDPTFISKQVPAASPHSPVVVVVFETIGRFSPPFSIQMSVCTMIYKHEYSSTTNGTTRD